MYATNVSWGETVEHLPIEVLDQLDVAEHVPVAYRVSFSAQMVRLLKQPLKNRGGVSILPTLENIIGSKEMTGTVENRDGLVIANIERVRCSGYGSRADAKGIVFQDVQFVAIRIRDESEIA